MQKWNHDIIGTHLSILIDTSEDCMSIFHDIETRLQDFEARFSRFIEGNWLYDLNISRRATLDEDAMKMLLFALEVARRTDGYFDLTVAKRLTELGYGNSKFKIQNSKGESGYGDYRDIEVIGDEVILHGDILLEFGGVGKGYLIDVIKGVLEYWSVRMLESGNVGFFDSGLPNTQAIKHLNPRYLINFGGDMYGCGGWTVGLESPFASDEVIGTLVLDDHFLACSAGTRRKWGDHHHLIDPHTGESAREVAASYIEGDSGICVDSYATALCVMPWEHAVATLRKTPEISGVIVRYDGSVYQKEGSRCELFS